MPILSLLLCLAGLAAPSFHRFDGPRPGVDVLKYEFNITLSDHSDVIEGTARVDVRFLNGPREFYLDLASLRPDDKGMSVRSIAMNDVPVRFEHEKDRLWIHPAGSPTDSLASFSIRYYGKPADGLIIGHNRYGDRTFFSDNWPDRARQWIPTVDALEDKALVDFVVTAPVHYQVVSNGRLVEEIDRPGGMRTSHWSTTQVLPTKIMVIGVARFSVQHLGVVGGVPLETWVYPQAEKAGFFEFAVAEPILSYFTQAIGPFPFARLANVQSTTRYGGMENASAIFYNENSITGSRRLETTIAHEIAHQWFGDSASEDDWHDVWLSEGFATYMAHLYFENEYGKSRLRERMLADRQTVLTYGKTHPRSSIVDTTLTDPNDVLSRDVYEKASWVLHMLRAMMGDEAFWRVVHQYYAAYRYDNASTADFRTVAESVSGQDLGWFFEQWMYRPGVPELRNHWRWDPDTREVVLDVDQRQPLLYRVPLEVAIEASGERTIHRVEISERRHTIRIKVDNPPEKLRLDPNVKLLANIYTG